MKKIATSLVLMIAGAVAAFAQGPITAVSGNDASTGNYGYSWISSESTIDTVWGTDSSTLSYDTIWCSNGGCPAVTDTLFSCDTCSALGSDSLVGFFDTTAMYMDTIVSISGEQGPAFSWIDISSIGTDITGGLGDDNVAGPFNIGFDMPYYWYTVDNFFIGSNGYIMFGNGTTISSGNDPAFPPFNVPNGDNHTNFIAPYLADLNLGQDIGGAQNPGTIYQYVNTAADTLIITFDQIPFWNDNGDGWGGSNTFQVIFSKVDGNITLNYLSHTGTWNSGYDGDLGASQIGMESVGEISTLHIASAVYVQDNLAIQITLEADTTFSVTDVSAAGNQNLKNGGSFVSSQREAMLKTNVQNIGTEDINSSFDVTTTLATGSNPNSINSRYSSTSTVSSLMASNTLEIEFADPFNPSDANTLLPGIDPQDIQLGRSLYMVTEIGVSGDGNPNNDEIISEVNVLADTNLSSVGMSFADMSTILIDFANGAGIFGFEGGGVYFQPPYYPVDLVAIRYVVGVDDPNGAANVPFISRVWGDDGINGNPGTVLATNTVANTAINATGITEVVLLNAITITEGGVYVGWQVDDLAASNIRLGTDQAGGPKSNNNYEILSGVFGEYRSNADEDLGIGILIDASAQDTIVDAIQEVSSITMSQVYPNPSTDVASVRFTTEESANVSFSVKNVIGQQVIGENIGNMNAGTRVITFNVADLEAGIYFYTLEVGATSETRKFIVK